METPESLYADNTDRYRERIDQLDDRASVFWLSGKNYPVLVFFGKKCFFSKLRAKREKKDKKVMEICAHIW